MARLIFICITFALLAGFFVLVHYEARRGVRLGASYRARLDEHVERIEFILAHIDLATFLRDEARHFVSRIGHDSVHILLLVVRAVERLLTRVIRHQHAKRIIDAEPVENTREFVKTLSDFKEQLDATRPQMPDIHKSDGF